MPKSIYESEHLARLMVRTDAMIAAARLPAFRKMMAESREAAAMLRYKLIRDERGLIGERALHVEDGA